LVFKIKIRNGKPTKLKRFVFKNLDTECSDGTSREFSRRLTGRGPRITRLGVTRVFTFAKTASPPSGLPTPNQLFISGRMLRSVARVSGVISVTVRFPSDQPSGETACVTGGLLHYEALR
jgi:hypothetical protein